MRNQSVGARLASPLQREGAVVTGLIVLQLILWLGFAVHRSPRFPGSLAGGVLAISGAVLMVLPSLAYVALKRVPGATRQISARGPLRWLLAWHVYGGILGSVLALLHTGHRFASPLGMALTGVMLVVVLSGYIGRHLLGRVSLELREQQSLLDQLVTEYNETARVLASQPRSGVMPAASQNPWHRLRRRLTLFGHASDDESSALAYRAAQVAGAIADLEYAIKTHTLLKRRFTVWLTVHVVASVAFYGLLALHIWASIYFGLRWLA